MKATKFITAIAATLIATSAGAQTFCERPVSFGAGEVPAAERTFYAHGCDRFQYSDLSPAQAANLIGAGVCSVEASANGFLEIEEVQVFVGFIPPATPNDDPTPIYETREIEVFTPTEGVASRVEGERCAPAGGSVPPLG